MSEANLRTFFIQGNSAYIKNMENARITDYNNFPHIPNDRARRDLSIDMQVARLPLEIWHLCPQNCFPRIFRISAIIIFRVADFESMAWISIESLWFYLQPRSFPCTEPLMFTNLFIVSSTPRDIWAIGCTNATMMFKKSWSSVEVGPSAYETIVLFFAWLKLHRGSLRQCLHVACSSFAPSSSRKCELCIAFFLKEILVK